MNMKNFRKEDIKNFKIYKKIEYIRNKKGNNNCPPPCHKKVN